MQASEVARYLLIAKEGFEAEPYQCSAGVWTNGFGNTEGVIKGKRINFIQALGDLNNKIKSIESEINRTVHVPLTQNQYDALVSFIYNIGVGAWRSSTLLKKLNEGKYQEASEEFTKWSFVKKILNKGLYGRRKIEKEVFLTV